MNTIKSTLLVFLTIFSVSATGMAETKNSNEDQKLEAALKWLNSITYLRYNGRDAYR